MQLSALTALLSSLALVSAQSSTTPVTGKLGDAQVVTTNPLGASYVATLPNKNTTNVRGSVAGTSATNGTGVVFAVSLSGFPTSGGPFLYHIHDAPVPSDGNCTGTLAHLDPTQRGEMPPCDPTMKQTCQTGDLSGKYGKIMSDPFSIQFTDLYASTKPGLGAFFGNRSITIHYANTTRITCANFTMSAAGSNSTSTVTILPTGTVTAPTKSASATTTAAQFTGAAVAKVAPFGAVLGGFVAALMV